MDLSNALFLVGTHPSTHHKLLSWLLRGLTRSDEPSLSIQRRLELQGGLQGGHKVGLQGVLQGLLQGVGWTKEESSMSQVLSRVVSIQVKV